jgi:hypothetical protein
MTDDELNKLRHLLPRKLCQGCGEQILQCQKRCPVCYVALTKYRLKTEGEWPESIELLPVSPLASGVAVAKATRLATTLVRSS